MRDRERDTLRNEGGVQEAAFRKHDDEAAELIKSQLVFFPCFVTETPRREL